jgi:Ca2+-binding RTX toxin-like protein
MGVNELPATGSFVEVLFEGAHVTAGPGCRLRSLDPHVFHCFGVSSVDVWTGDRPDEVYLSGQDPTTVHAGAGRDFLSGSGGPDTLVGGDGRDNLIGRAGPDTLLGGPGNDVLDGFHAGNLGGVPSGPDEDLLNGGPGMDLLFGGPASDRLVGGTGNDQLDGGENDVIPADPGADVISGGVVDYSSRRRPVTVTDTPLQRSGSPAEDDSVLAVRVARTGSGDDTADIAHPGARIFGNAGGDTLVSTSGGGAIFGGSGDDTLTVSGAATVVRGEAGDDHFSTADGVPDVDSCGPGHDTVMADASDTVSANCEDVTVTP